MNLYKINELKERIRYNEKQLLKSRSYSEYEFYMKQIDYYKEKLNKIKEGKIKWANKN